MAPLLFERRNLRFIDSIHHDAIRFGSLLELANR